jgi:Ca-activated chloride channel homolog
MHSKNTRTLLSLTTLLLLLAPVGGSSDDYASSESGDSFGGDTSGASTGVGDGDGDGDGWDEGGDPTGDSGDGDGDGDRGGDGDGDSRDDDGADEGEEPEPLCNADDDVVLYLSPDDSNSMSAPVQVRHRVLDAGSTSLTGVPVRTWEFMNYYGFDYPAAEDGELALYAAMQPVEAAESTWRLQLAAASEVMTPDERPPMNVTLVLDTSGSMSGLPMDMLKESCRAIAANLKAGDKISMVEWDTANTWTLAGYAVSGPNDSLLLEKVEALKPGGGTNLNGGLVSGYELAQQVFDLSAINRLVLITDGGANAGVTDIDLIAQNAAYGGSDGIYLVGVGVPQGQNYNDELIDAVTDAGKGASVYIPDVDEAWSIFGANFENTMAIAGRDVQVELVMPPGFEIIKFSGEEFSSDPHEIEPQHIAPNDAMVFHQHIKTCAPELIDDDAEIQMTATWQDPWSFEVKQLSQTWTFAELTAMDQSLLLKGAAILAYAESLAVYKKAGTTAQKLAALQPALDALAVARAARPDDDDLLEVASILAVLTP